MQTQTGQHFSRLITLDGYEKRHEKNGNSFWWRECLCDCGNTKWIKDYKLLGENGTKSCGCLANEVHAERMRSQSRGFATHRKWRPILPFGVSASKRLFKSYAYQAGKRDYEFEISLDLFLLLTKKDCYYCGTAPTQVTNYLNVNGQYIYNGVDRLDNNIGYTVENCVSCCGICNQMKMDLGYKEFLAYIERIYNRLVKNA